MEEHGDLEKVRELALTEEELGKLEREIEGYEREITLTGERLDALRKRLEGYGDTPPPKEVERELSLFKERFEELMRRIGELGSELQQRRKLLIRKNEIEKRLKDVERELSLYMRLSEDLRSDRLQDFAASLMLKRIVERASEYLYNFTGTYELDMDASGDLLVVDRVQGSERDVKSLSGGETFLASLSLALGVSDVLSAKAHLESLFIDEGFGSLDEETRERVSDILEVIKQRINRMVGIISHIPDLAERFHQRIVVSKHGDFSTVEVLY
ncbi:MAG: SbcC/MukB-like Walker B domain-containing protein [Aquificota bacterium]|nr:SbcC/MukB-like Walker B domain-containing protein [Aquificota bacterium]